MFAHQLYYQPSDFDIADRVTALANERGVRPIQVALAWILRQPQVVAPIIGTTRLEQLDELVGALPLALSEAEDRFLTELYTPHRVLGHE